MVGLVNSDQPQVNPVVRFILLFGFEGGQHIFGPDDHILLRRAADRILLALLLNRLDPSPAGFPLAEALIEAVDILGQLQALLRLRHNIFLGQLDQLDFYGDAAIPELIAHSQLPVELVLCYRDELRQDGAFELFHLPFVGDL